MMADLSEIFEDIGIDPLLFFMMSGLFGGRRGGGMPFGDMRGGMRGGMRGDMRGGFMGGRGRGPVVFMSSGGPAMFYTGALLQQCVQYLARVHVLYLGLVQVWYETLSERHTACIPINMHTTKQSLKFFHK
jgi:hypothetical protein